MSDQTFIAIDIQGEKEIADMLKRVPPALRGTVVEDTAKLMLKIVKVYPQYLHVTRKRAYPPTGWQSARQRRYVMMAIHKGWIRPGVKNRSNYFRQRWELIGKGENMMVANQTPYGQYLKDNDRQANMMTLIGWNRLADDITDNQPKITKQIDLSVHKALRKAGAKGL